MTEYMQELRSGATIEYAEGFEGTEVPETP
jgi:hypothetical protein